MRPFIVIRDYKPADEIACKEVIKNYVMSFAQDAFVSCIFREISIQLTVLIAALMFIFLGIPLLFCLAAVPVVCVILLTSVYSTYFGKAMELTAQPMRNCWVAEVYEPYLLGLSGGGGASRKQQTYDIVHEDSILPNDVEVNRMQRKIIGFVSICQHKSLENCGWINRMSVNSKYDFDRVAEPLINRALKHGLDINLYTIEATTTECQFDFRELLQRMGFQMKQIYHKQVLGSNSLRVMKSQMGIDLMTWSVSKNK